MGRKVEPKTVMHLQTSKGTELRGRYRVRITRL